MQNIWTWLQINKIQSTKQRIYGHGCESTKYIIYGLSVGVYHFNSRHVKAKQVMLQLILLVGHFDGQADVEIQFRKLFQQRNSGFSTIEFIFKIVQVHSLQNSFRCVLVAQLLSFLILPFKEPFSFVISNLFTMKMRIQSSKLDQLSPFHS